MSTQTDNFGSKYDAGNEVDRELYAWVEPETKRLVDVVYQNEGYPSRSAFVRAILREYFGLPVEDGQTSVGGTDGAQALLTDGGTREKEHSFDLSD